MSDWEPTPEWLDAAYAREVRPAVFGHAEAVDSPTLVMIGGQPAAGKTRAGQWAAAQHLGPLPEVTGDDLRYLHPDYRWLKRHAPLQMPNVTQRVSGPLVARCIDEAVNRRYSLQLEGVFRNAAVVTDTVDRFHSAGYTVHVVALAVPPPVSRVSAVQRFVTEGRWTPPTAHDSAVQALPATAQALATHRHVDRFTVVDRSGTLMDSTAPGPDRGQQARTVMHHAHTRPLTAAEARDVSELRRVIAAAAASPGTRLFHLGAEVAASTTRWAEQGPDPSPASATTTTTSPAVVAASFPDPAAAATRTGPPATGRPAHRRNPKPGPGLDR